jgi:hypothetical protein
MEEGGIEGLFGKAQASARERPAILVTASAGMPTPAVLPFEVRIPLVLMEVMDNIGLGMATRRLAPMHWK